MKKKPNPKEQLKRLQEKLAAKSGYRYQGIFNSIFYPYKEALYLTGAIPSLDMSRRLKSNAGSIKGQVKASRSDFIADIEITVKECLVPYHQRLFRSMVEMQFIPDTTKYANIAERLGEEFKKRGIYPLKDYLRAKHAIPRREK
jgi:hypothetical protein